MLILTKCNPMDGVTTYRSVNLREEAKAILAKQILCFTNGDQRKANQLFAVVLTLVPLEKFIPKYVEGSAHCSPNDDFSLIFGMGLAKTRCLMKEYFNLHLWLYAIYEEVRTLSFAIGARAQQARNRLDDLEIVLYDDYLRDENEDEDDTE